MQCRDDLASYKHFHALQQSRAMPCRSLRATCASAILPGCERGRGRARAAGGHARRAEPVQPTKVHDFKACPCCLAGGRPHSAGVATHTYIFRRQVHACQTRRVCSNGPVMELLALSWHVTNFLTGLPFSARMRLCDAGDCCVPVHA